MDWISFFWGVGAIIFVNIVYTILVVPKQLKQIAELENRVGKAEGFSAGYEDFMSEYEEKLISLQKERDEVMLALDRLESSIKLRKTCPACRHEFSLYVVEEET